VANSDSRANSPGTSSNAMPVEPKTTTTFQQPDTMEGPLKLKPEQMTRDCIDNTGSRQDTGYTQGYAYGQRERSERI
jgi:hypothetical protein